MTQAAIDYATSLRKTETPKELLQQVKDVLEAVPQVRSEFEDPTVSIEKKHLIIAGTKALISALIAGGWITVVIILIVVLLGCADRKSVV